MAEFEDTARNRRGAIRFRSDRRGGPRPGPRMLLDSESEREEQQGRFSKGLLRCLLSVVHNRYRGSGNCITKRELKRLNKRCMDIYCPKIIREDARAKFFAKFKKKESKRPGSRSNDLQ